MKKNSGIKIIFFDVDGTLTDGKIYMGQGGELFKAFSVLDGYALNTILKKEQLIPYILTARESAIVKRRCEELKIENCCQNCTNKKELLEQVGREYGFVPNESGVYNEFAYMGDDMVDYEAMKICAITGCPQNAIKEIKEISNYVCQNYGGSGAAREFIEWLCSVISSGR